MSISEEQVREALRAVRYPGFSRDIVSFGLVRSVQIDDGEVRVQLALVTNDPNVPATIKTEAEKALRALSGVRTAKVLIDIHAPPGGAGAAPAPPGGAWMSIKTLAVRTPLRARKAFSASVLIVAGTFGSLVTSASCTLTSPSSIWTLLTSPKETISRLKPG